jgi:hypothetical protein
VAEHRHQGYWNDKVNQKDFLDRLAIKLNIQKPEDWIKVSTKLVLNEGGHFLKKYDGSLIKGTSFK